MKEKIVRKNLFRIKSKTGHTCMAEDNEKEFSSIGRKCYISIAILAGDLEWLIIIIYTSDMKIFHHWHKWIKYVVFWCHTVLFWLPHAIHILNRFLSSTFGNYVIFLIFYILIQTTPKNWKVLTQWEFTHLGPTLNFNTIDMKIPPHQTHSIIGCDG